MDLQEKDLGKEEKTYFFTYSFFPSVLMVLLSCLAESAMRRPPHLGGLFYVIAVLARKRAEARRGVAARPGSHSCGGFLTNSRPLASAKAWPTRVSFAARRAGMLSTR